MTRLLEVGLGVLLATAPLAFGAVGPGGRLYFELLAFVLGGLALVRAAVRPTALPPRAALAGLALLLALAVAQVAPLRDTVVGAVFPRASAIRGEAATPPDLAAAEASITGAAGRPTRATVSLSPPATASALRTGAALALVLLVATAVAAERGASGIALAVLFGAAFQGLYGILVVASGNEAIWGIPKQASVGAATGTFVNRNHFAAYLAATLPCGLGLVLERWRRHRESRGRLPDLLGGAGSRTLLLGLLFLVGLAGLLLSFSRAGITVGLLGLALTALAAQRRRSLAALALALLITAVAAVPLLQIGADRLAERYGRTTEELAAVGGRASVWTDTLEMAAAFPVAGAGFGTFSAVYPLFRSPDVRSFFAHAHQDLFQLAAEGGFIGLLGLLLFLGPVAVRIAGGVGGSRGVMAAALSAGLAALLLHALVDFPFRIPAVAAVGAALAGLLMGLPWNARR